MKWIFQGYPYFINAKLPRTFFFKGLLRYKAISLFFLSFLIAWATQAQNPIATENALPGNPSSQWDISGAGDPTIQGFATEISVNKGSTVNFKINVTGTNKNFSINIYRLGYYQGNGARLISNLGTFTGVTQPSPSINASVGLVDCGNWSQSPVGRFLPVRFPVFILQNLPAAITADQAISFL